MIIDGKATAKQIKDELKERVGQLTGKGIKPALAVVIVGDNAASHVYVRSKKKACQYIGIQSFVYELPEETTEKELLHLVHKLNNNSEVHGILVQLPLPPHISEEKVIIAIDPKKDVDGFHPINVGNLSIGNQGFVSCTPYGIMELLKRHHISVQGKKCVVLGRSNIVGKPMAMLLLRENGTVTLCHSKTKNLKEECRQGDILIVAIGRSKMVTKEYVKEGAVVVDVGMNRLGDGTLCGDVDYEDVETHVSWITPVPGGVGPMTIAMLMKNVVKSAEESATQNIGGKN